MSAPSCGSWSMQEMAAIYAVCEMEPKMADSLIVFVTDIAGGFEWTLNSGQ